jgi:tetratricopeptide (TPR) repeat protein
MAHWLGAPHRIAAWLLAAVLVLLTLLAYQPVWHAGFIFDDDVMLTGNPAIHAADGLRNIWWSTLLPDYFPMTSTVLWLEWRFWGENPLGYHLVNVLLHAAGGVVLWRVLNRLQLPGAWLAAAIFALHPVNVESVAWITELKNTLAMLFFSITLLAYLRFEEDAETQNVSGKSAGRCNGVLPKYPEGRAVCPQPAANVQNSTIIQKSGLSPKGWYGLALGAFVLALLSKSAVAPLPVVLLGLAWWRCGRVTLRDARRLAPFFAASALFALVAFWFQQHRAIGSTLVRDDNFWSRLAGAGSATWFYLYKAFLPVNLSFVYPRWQFNMASALSYLPGLILLAGLLACWRFRTRWGNAWLFAFGYFVLMLTPVLGFVNISFMRYSFVADRWQYFALLGPIALVAAGLTRHLQFTIRGLQFGHAPFSAALLLALGVLTWRQAGMYTNPEILWTATLERNPNCFLAQTELGNILMGKDRVDEALTRYRAALEISPKYELALYNLGYGLQKQEKITEAIVEFEKAVAVRPDYLAARYHLGAAMAQAGQWPQAVAELKRAVDLEPRFAEAQNSLGEALLNVNRLDEAIVHLQKALQLQPGYPKALNNLGVARVREGRLDEARLLFQQAVELQPGFPEGESNLGASLLMKGEVRGALAHYRASLASQPDHPDTLSNLAWVLATCVDASLRDGTEALNLASRANRLSRGENPGALRALAAAYAETGRFDEAVEHARRALKLAQSSGDEREVAALRTQLACYEADNPFRAH